MIFLCSNLGNGPAGTQACPAGTATITGTIHDSDVVAGAGAQGVARKNPSYDRSCQRGRSTRWQGLRAPFN